MWFDIALWDERLLLSPYGEFEILSQKFVVFFFIRFGLSECWCLSNPCGDSLDSICWFKWTKRLFAGKEINFLQCTVKAQCMWFFYKMFYWSKHFCWNQHVQNYLFLIELGRHFNFSKCKTIADNTTWSLERQGWTSLQLCWWHVVREFTGRGIEK